MNYQYVHENRHPSDRLLAKIARKSQVKTCHPAKRPFGVGLLVASIDETGTHLFETCPSANYYEYYAMAIGARCQSAKTYLEKNFDSFKSLGWEDLVVHGLKALKASAQETELNDRNISVGIVGKDMPFRVLEGDDLRRFLAQIQDGADVVMT